MQPPRLRQLGVSGLQVSELSLGSWRTYERLPRDAGLAVMRTALEAGINFLDDARYDDETGTAPIPTGYSEVVFGELFRAAGWPRDQVVVANKLWWELWPQQSAAAELEGSLGRMGFDHVDLIYTAPPPQGLPVDDLVGAIAALIASGKARAWGVLNWPPGVLAEAAQVAGENGLPGPCAAQLAYSLVQRSPVEDPAMLEVLQSCGIAVVASAVLAGGVLTGKYTAAAGIGRMAGQLDDPRIGPALAAGEALRALAEATGLGPAGLAIAFALANPAVTSVLFGATTAQQVLENLAALDVPARLDAPQLAQLRDIGSRGSPR
jgi:aryl-alcohol dehydrogenase-like predicted oxidoreductase